MKVTITVRGIDGEGSKESASIKNYIEEHFAKVIAFVDREEWKPVHADLVALVASPHPHHTFDVHIRAPHFSVHVERKNAELYRAIDEAIDIALSELREHKERLIDKKRDGDSYKSA